MGRYQNAWNIFLTVCGLNCVERVEDKDGNIRFDSSRRKLIFPMIIIGQMCLLAFYLAKGIATTEMGIGYGTKVSAYLNVTGLGVSAAIVLCATASASEFARIQHRFTQFDDLIKIDYRTLIKSILRYAILFATIYTFSFIIDFLAFQYDTSQIAPLKVVSAHIFHFYNFFSILHFSVCLFWLRKSFALINSHLDEKMETIKAWSTKKYTQNMFRHNMVDPDYRFEFLRLTAKDTRKLGWSAVERLRFLRTLYHTSFELTRDVNAVFATRNVISVGYNFVVGTIFMYSGMSELVHWAGGGSKATGLELLVHFKWSFLSFMSIYSLVWPSTSTCNEACKTAVSIQGLLTKTLSEELRTELQSSCFQFVNEQVSFSPHGFFSLNNSLLLSIMGAVVSYLVVLIQFQISMS